MNFKKIFLFLGIIIFLFSGIDAKTHLETAIEYSEKSQQYFEKAVEELNFALNEQQADKDKINFLLGKLYYQHGRYLDAQKILSPLYEKNKEDFSLAKILAISYFHLNNYTSALEIFERFAQEKDSEFLYYYGKTLQNQNLFEKAIEIYSKIEDPPYLLWANSEIEKIEISAETVNFADLEKEIQNLIISAGSQQDYPNAGAIILLCNEEMEINPDYSATWTIHFMVKILNQRGKKRFAEIELEYDSTYEKLELIFARTIKPDGKIVYPGEKQIRDVSKYLDFPLYSNARAMIISMPEVEENVIIEYKAVWKMSKLTNDKDICFHYKIQDYEPILNQSFVFVVPKEYDFDFKHYDPDYLNFDLDFTAKIVENNGKKKYKWEFSNIPEIIYEPGMPPLAEITPFFVISSFNSWQDIHNWWWKLVEDKIKTTPEIEVKVNELTNGINDKFEIAKKIYSWCAEKIRYVGVEYGEAGYEPHSANEVFKNKYGDCKDQSILLTSMLKFAGIDAYPVLIGTKGTYLLDEDFPALSFNHCIVMCMIEGKEIFLDPTGETVSFGDLPFADQARKVLVFYPQKVEIKNTPLLPQSFNYVNTLMKIKINNDETISGEREVITFGGFNQSQRYWLKYTKPPQIKDALQQRINEISPGAKLSSYEITGVDNLDENIRLKMEFSGEQFLLKAGDKRLIPPLSGLDVSIVAKEKRNYPLEFSILSKEITLIEIYLAQNLAVEYLPEPIEEKNEFFELTLNYEYFPAENKIIFTQIYQTNDIFLDKDEYLKFKEIYQQLALKAAEQVILSR